MIRVARLLPAALVAAVAAVALAGPAAAVAAKPAGNVRQTSGMYGKRYCEYLVVRGTLPNLTATVWSTFGLNTCPDAQWKQFDAPAIKAMFGALTVVNNGPRYWLMDRTKIALATTPGGEIGTVRTFPNGLRLRALATVQVPLRNGVPGNSPYNEVTVNRRNTFTFSKRHKVHELLAPDGRVFVMQTYAQIADPTLTRAGLDALGTRLALPTGWSYRTRRLKRDLHVVARGKATLVQDELQNSYQLER